MKLMKLRNWLLVAALCFPLASCIPLVLVAGATTSLVVFDKRSIKTQFYDKQIANIAQKRINNSPELNNGRTHISVSVFDGILLMVGQAQTAELKKKAYERVAGLKHVKRVYNEVKISGATSTLGRTNDTWITAKVKTKFLMQKGLHSAQIKVVTDEGIVYLMGLVKHSQADLAAEVARKVEGVRKVYKVFEYIK